MTVKILCLVSFYLLSKIGWLGPSYIKIKSNIKKETTSSHFYHGPF